MKLSELLNNELIIPEIQRDYVWGNNEIVLRRFLKNIFNNIINDKENKLDIGFFYSYKVYQNEEIYALIDGQQRITTLVLLYWYLGIGEDYIKKFKFKVRENCNNFLEKLLEENISKIGKINGESISKRIKNCIWYLSIWDNDPTVKSMLKALDIIENEFNKITENKEYIKNNIENKIIFTCITNDNRSLEKEYISLNARGRELEKYEKLKAILVEDMDNRNEWLKKWEKDWQDILWECKGDNVYNTDNIWNAVLYWARDIFVIENNICKPDTEKEKIDFDFDLMSIKVKNDKGENYKDILLKIFDWIIPALKIINEYKNLFQKKCQFNDENKVIDINTIIAGDSINNDKFTYSQRALFYGLLYLVKSKYNIVNVKSIKDIESVESIKDKNLTIDENDEILEKTRVFRNLIENSGISSESLNNAVKSLELLSKKTISDFPNELLNNKEIKGISPEQKYEEALKLEIFKQYPQHKDTILKIENDALFKGRIKNIFILYYYKYKNIDIETLFDGYDIYNSFYKNNYKDFDIIIKNKENIDIIKNIEKLYNIYKEINEKGLLWTLRWELLLYKFYLLYGNRILLYDYDRKDMYAILLLTYLLSINQNDINKFNEMQKSKVNNILKDKSNIDHLNIKEKLYLIYAMDKNIMDNKIMEMFRNDRQFRIEYQNNNIVFCSFNKIKGKNDHRMEFNEELKDRLKKFINDEYNIQL